MRNIFPVIVAYSCLLLSALFPYSASNANEIWSDVGSNTAGMQGGYAHGNDLFICRIKTNDGVTIFGKSINEKCYTAHGGFLTNSKFEYLSQSSIGGDDVYAWVSPETKNVYEANNFKYVDAPGPSWNRGVCQARNASNLHPGYIVIGPTNNREIAGSESGHLCHYEYKGKQYSAKSTDYKILMYGTRQNYVSAYQELEATKYYNKLITWPDYAICTEKMKINEEANHYVSYEPFLATRDNSFDHYTRGYTSTGIYVEKGDRIFIRASGSMAGPSPDARVSVAYWDARPERLRRAANWITTDLRKYQALPVIDNGPACQENRARPTQTFIAPESGPVYLVAGGSTHTSGSVTITGGTPIPQFKIAEKKPTDAYWKNILEKSESPFVEIVSANLVTLAKIDSVKNVSISKLQQAGTYWEKVLRSMGEFTSIESLPNGRTAKAFRQRPHQMFFYSKPGDTLAREFNGYNTQEFSAIPQALFGGFLNGAYPANSRTLPETDSLWVYFHELAHSFQARNWTLAKSNEVWTGEATNNLAALYAIENTQPERSIKDSFTNDDEIPPKSALRYWKAALGNDERRQQKIKGTRDYFEKIEKNNSDLFTNRTNWDWLPTVSSTASQTLFFYILRAEYGWDVYKNAFEWYVDNKPSISEGNNRGKMDILMERLSIAAGANLSPYFKTWGFINSEEAANRVAALGLEETHLNNPEKIMEVVTGLLD